MSSETTSHRRAFWLMMLLFLVVAVGLIAFLLTASDPPPFHSPPDRIRPWEETAYDQTFDPSHRSPLPILATDPVPAVTLKMDPPPASGTLGTPPGPQKLEITLPFDSHGSRDTFHEILPADPSGRVTLPDGSVLTLAAVAVLLPSDRDPESEQRYVGKVPDWIDPRNGQSIPSAAWQNQEGIPSNGPRLFLRVEKSGEAPVRWLWSEAFDARTRARFGSSASHSPQQPHGMFWIDLDCWHQTPLKLGVQFAFGTPVEEPIPLEKGAEVSFGNEARVELLEVLPHGHGSSSWGGGGSQSKVTFSLSKPDPKRPGRSFIFQVWPPQNQYLIEFRNEPRKINRLLTGNYGVSGMELHGEDSTITKASLRRFPRLGRAVFDLSEIPRLPEVSNLFETPIERVEIVSDGSFLRAAVEPAQVQTRFSNHANAIPDSDFPLTLTDTSPIEILREYERMSGKILYFDDEALLVTDQKPSGLVDKLKEWWKKNRPGWLP